MPLQKPCEYTELVTPRASAVSACRLHSRQCCSLCGDCLPAPLQSCRRPPAQPGNDRPNTLYPKRTSADGDVGCCLHLYPNSTLLLPGAVCQDEISSKWEQIWRVTPEPSFPTDTEEVPWAGGCSSPRASPHHSCQQRGSDR